MYMLAFVVFCIFIADIGATQPPMLGWRSWNCFKMQIDAEKLISTGKALITPVRPGAHSYFALGFTSVGMDDGWQACGKGVDGGYHDQHGNPIVNTTRFPDMRAYVDSIHRLGLKAGWYLNNCGCSGPDKRSGPHVVQDSAALVAFGFDSVKVDSCGAATNITAWRNSVPDRLAMENCGDNEGQIERHEKQPTIEQAWACPWKPGQYRISHDIAPQFLSTMYNLNYMVPFTTPRQGRPNTTPSRPGCWAYPDMLQVARLANEVEDRTHYSAWCVTSSPLIIGADITNHTTSARLYSTISNSVALRVNQHYDGYPGTLVRNASVYFDGLAAHGAGGACDNGPNGGSCTTERFPVWQIWAKPLGSSFSSTVASSGKGVGDEASAAMLAWLSPATSGGSVRRNVTAVLIINLSTSPQSVSVPLQEIGLPVAVRWMDVYASSDTGSFKERLQVNLTQGHSSQFILVVSESESTL